MAALWQEAEIDKDNQPETIKQPIISKDISKPEIAVVGVCMSEPIESLVPAKKWSEEDSSLLSLLPLKSLQSQSTTVGSFKSHNSAHGSGDEDQQDDCWVQDKMRDREESERRDRPAEIICGKQGPVTGAAATIIQV